MKKKEINKNVYCDTRNCPHKHCLKKINNAPFDELISVVRYQPDKDGKCKGLLED